MVNKCTNSRTSRCNSNQASQCTSNQGSSRCTNNRSNNQCTSNQVSLCTNSQASLCISSRPAYVLVARPAYVLIARSANNAVTSSFVLTITGFNYFDATAAKSCISIGMANSPCGYQMPFLWHSVHNRGWSKFDRLRHSSLLLTVLFLSCVLLYCLLHTRFKYLHTQMQSLSKTCWSFKKWHFWILLKSSKKLHKFENYLRI